MVRIAAVCLGFLLLCGCTAMLLGNGSSSGAPGPSASASSDATISDRVKASLAADSQTAAFSFSVRSYSGSVILSGSVDSYVAREQAGNIAKATAGVRAVTNQIVVEN